MTEGRVYSSKEAPRNLFRLAEFWGKMLYVLPQKDRIREAAKCSRMIGWLWWLLFLSVWLIGDVSVYYSTGRLETSWYVIGLVLGLVGVFVSYRITRVAEWVKEAGRLDRWLRPTRQKGKDK